MALLESLHEQDIGAKTKAKIKEFIILVQPEDEAVEATLAKRDLEQVISFLRIEKHSDTTKIKLMLGAMQWTMREAIIAAFDNEGKAVHHTGPAPPGWLEEEASLWLEALKEHSM